MEYLRGAKGSWIWLVIRLYVGYQWMTAGWHKIAGEKPFDATGYLKGAMGKILVADPTKAKPITATWWGEFLRDFAIPNVKLFNVMIPWGEFLVGVALIIGFTTIFAAVMASLMNFAFLMSGSTSSNPYLFALQFILVAAGGAYAGYIGLDYYVRPILRRTLASVLGQKTETRTASTTA